jgi:Undecaprenyl-phosphate galactose phosphotransferase WbaP
VIVNAMLLISDLLAVAASFALSYLIRRYAPILDPIEHGFNIYLAAWPALLVWPLVMWREKLYPGFWLPAREELRRCMAATSLASLTAVSLTFLTRTGPQFSRPVVVGGWVLSLVLLPVSRHLVRLLMIRLGLAGPQAVILGAGKTAHLAIAGLHGQRPPALRPVAVFDDDVSKHNQVVEGVPVVGTLSQAEEWATARGVRNAVIAMPGVPREKLLQIVDRHASSFQRILVIPDLFGLSAAEASVHELQGALTLEIRRNLLYRRNRIAKRVIDVALLALGSPVILPLSSMIALAIVLESGRPSLFTHSRIGKGGARFQAWKFRTMVQGAPQVLAAYLEQHPELKTEWEVTHKLKHDPRMTAVGRLLRRLSLDELPQMWNIARGEMSLVGPRPIVEEEIPKYGDRFDLYTQVLPGLTGLWQVSGRSDLSYADRVWLDTHYVRNWSIWMDLVILVRTVWVVFTGKGAY